MKMLIIKAQSLKEAETKIDDLNDRCVDNCGRVYVNCKIDSFLKSGELEEVELPHTFREGEFPVSVYKNELSFMGDPGINYWRENWGAGPDWWGKEMIILPSGRTIECFTPEADRFYKWCNEVATKRLPKWAIQQRAPQECTQPCIGRVC